MDSGLAGIAAAETVLSHSDGPRGILWVRGHTLAELVADFGYDGAAALLWDGFAGDGLTRADVGAAFGAGRVRAFAGLGGWLDAAATRPLVEGVRQGLAALPEDSEPAEIVAALTVATAALLRRHRGAPPVAPDPALGTAADLLRMVQGAPAPAAHAAALDTYWTAIIDNGLNASSFTARIVASTRASLAAAALGAYCAFTGELHGGAPGPTLDMLDEAAACDDVEAWAAQKFVAGERVMGFGHRVFRNGDPRAEALRGALQCLGPQAGRLAFAATVERQVASAFARVKPGRPTLQPNVEINAALLLDAVGFPREAFTPIFAVGRSVGWLAHAMEQRRANRMIRPGSTYIGPVPSPANA